MYTVASRARAAGRLYGREADIARLRAQIGSGAPLVTLFGAPGIGKTALASELAALEADASGSIFVDLSVARDEPSVCLALAHALGVPLDPRRDGREQIEAALHAQRRRPAILLDSCDRAIAAMIELLRGWLAARVPALFIVTSRELLGLVEEHAHEVGPLALPPPGEHDSEAVRLFLARAERTRREALQPANSELVTEIVRSLEGIPLALELAASRLSVLSLRELRARLASPVSVLTSNRMMTEARHQTMRAAIEWSWTQLASHEQAVLRQLSVFRGGFDARAAEAVVDLGAPPGPRVIDVLQSLRSKSLVYGEETGDGVRLKLYEVIRDFAEQELRAAGEDVGAIARHAVYFVAQGKTWSPAAGATRDGGGLDRVAAHLDDLLAVHARALDGRTPRGGEDALRVVAALGRFMRERWPARQSLALVDATLRSPRVRGASRILLCEALLLRSRLLERLGCADARASAEEALSLARAEESPRLEASALALLGTLALSRSDVLTGSGKLREALALLPELDPGLAADTYGVLAMALRTTGDLDAAKRAYDSAVSLRARIRDEGGAAVDLAGLAALRHQCGDLERARDLLEDAEARAKARGDRYTHAYVVGILAAVLSEQDLHDDAAARYEEAISELDELGERRLRALLLGYSAAARQLAGASIPAAAAYGESISALREQGDLLHEGLFAGAAATLAWARGDGTEAESLYELARDRLGELATSVNPRLSLVLSLYLGHRDLWMRRAALGAGDDRAAKAHLEAARERMAGARGYVGDHDDLRLAYRLLHAEVERHVSGPRRAGEIQIGPDVLWFRVAGQPRVDLRRRRALRLLLRALVEQRLRAPGSPVSMARLVARGWPGEKLLLHAGMNRLYVAVRSLRELGLRSALLRQDDGYLLDPGIGIVEVASRLDETTTHDQA